VTERRILLAICLTLLLTSVGRGGEEVLIDGALHVQNPAQPTLALETYELEELWRVGAEDDDLFFGLIVAVRIDEAGNILLLDETLSQVFVLSPTGELIATLSRPGEGPGETQSPNDLVLLPNGRIGIAHGTSGRLVTLDRDGNPTGDIHVNRSDPGQGGMTLLRNVNAGGGNLVFGSVDMGVNQKIGFPTREVVLASHDMDGRRLATYHQRDTQFEFDPFGFSEKKNLEFDNYRFGVGPDGRVYCATEHDPYKVMVYNMDGTVDRIITRTHETVMRSPAEYEAMVNLFDSALRREVPPPFDLEVARNEPAICWLQRGLQIAQDGRLWILPSSGVRNQPDGIYQTFDVFTTDGHFEKQVAIAGEGDPREDAVFLAGPDHLVRILGFADALLTKVGGSGGSEDEEAEPIQAVYYRMKPVRDRTAP